MASDDRNRFGRSFGEGYSYVAVGFQLAAIILVFGGLGWVVDGWLHTRPLLAIAGFLVGTAGWFTSLYYADRRGTEAAERDTRKGNREGWGLSSFMMLWSGGRPVVRRARAVGQRAS